MPSVPEWDIKGPPTWIEYASCLKRIRKDRRIFREYRKESQHPSSLGPRWETVLPQGAAALQHSQIEQKGILFPVPQSLVFKLA